jgi:hypothetical protein
VAALVHALAGTPGMSSFKNQLGSLNNLSGVPNKTVQLNLTVANGIVSSLELPLNQFQTSSSSSGPSSLKLDVSPSGAVSAPSGATAINLPQLLHAAASSSSGSSSG